MLDHPDMAERGTSDSENKAAAADSDKAETASADIVSMPMTVRSVSLSIIAVLAAILVLQYAQSVLIPVVLGVLLSYALSPLVAALARYHVPRVIGAGLAVSLLVGSIGVGIYTLSDEAVAIVANVPEAAKRVRERVASHRRQRGTALSQMQEAAKEIEKTADCRDHARRNRSDRDEARCSAWRSCSPDSERRTTSGSAAWGCSDSSVSSR